MRFNALSMSHGWRRFLLEVAIVVIGVLIALGGGQIAEEWNWRHKVGVAEAQLKWEGEVNFYNSAEQAAVAPCVDAQLAALQARLLASGDVLDPAPFYEDDIGRYVYRTPSRSYPSVAWRALNADGTAAHLDGWRHDQYSKTYSQVTALEQMSRDADIVLGRLAVLGAAIPLDAGTRAHLLEGIEEQRNRTGLQSLIALQLMGALRDLGVAPPIAEVARIIGETGTAKFCREHRLPVADWPAALAALPAFVDDKAKEQE